MSYILDFIYGATKYPCAWLKPLVRKGYFLHKHQELFFRILIELGFERTYWQLVFPGQTAGLVKKVSDLKTKANEYHVRFYLDGSIDCELEYDRWSRNHWIGERQSGVDFLNSILEEKNSNLSKIMKLTLANSFRDNAYSLECSRKVIAEN